MVLYDANFVTKAKAAIKRALKDRPAALPVPQVSGVDMMLVCSQCIIALEALWEATLKWYIRQTISLLVVIV
jgi:hypothetical protein